MGCCGKKAAEEDAVELQDMKHFQKNPQGGVRPKRKCRDLLFACLFIAFWAGMLIIAAFSFSKGNPERCDFAYWCRNDPIERFPALLLRVIAYFQRNLTGRLLGYAYPCLD
jgi:hypothetical protein